MPAEVLRIIQEILEQDAGLLGVQRANGCDGLRVEALMHELTLQPEAVGVIQLSDHLAPLKPNFIRAC